ncbi:hypothetical protein TVAG_343370 [Trichomonas vaginalis G3]|uniref:Thioredoxin domain-containing protein n=1 Tax=Trichomonas vaginalis (strain ATCC PRA-98 / G3) TaxID=412133 RepID=A2E1E1_TRIV3|nr:thioredoxin-like family [Trichomonas vaginalis G3]EAY13508.1 hypothetical protein TVAG_343370 [Trichomonas vaginalis G3]KAI5529227.1 thioredoxin-like family [Trichomonas vaginalis G3]|eukprot:XP_001325731.1 hypothetical protein [Trichomonas vaginalis G3]
MFLLLPFFTNSLWYKYSSRTFNQKVKESYTTPIVTLLYRPSCDHCHGHPERIEAYSNLNPTRKDVLFTHINCDIEFVCSKFHVQYYPSYVIIVGEKPRYWPEISSRDQNSWEQAIKYYTDHKFTQINNTNEFNKALETTLTGGTMFYVESKTENDPILESIKSEMIKYKIYNDSFVYSINPTIKESTLTAYRSPYCSTKFKGVHVKSEITGFLNDYRFGHMHKYTYNEWYEETSARRTMVLFEYERDLPVDRSNQLIKYSQMYCTNTSMGWAIAKHNMHVVRALGLNDTEYPIVVTANRETGCVAAFKIDDPQSVRLSMSSQLCQPRFKNVWGTALIRMKMKGSHVVWILSILGLSAISVIRLYETWVSKDE